MADDVLQKAVQLAKSGKVSEATLLLKSYIRKNPKDAGAWWLIAVLVSDPKVKLESLKRVLILKPDHIKAKTMLAALEAREAPPQPKPSDGADWLTADIPNEDDGFPSMELFGVGSRPATPKPDKPSRSTVDEKVLFENLQRKKQEQQRASSVKQEIDDRTWLYILGGVVTIAAIIIAVLGVFYIRSVRGPSLNATATNNYMSIKYPEEWRAVKSGSYTIVVSTSPINTEDINPWGVMHDIDIRSYPFWLKSSLEYWGHYYSFGYDFEDYDDPAEVMTSALTGGFGYEEIDPEKLLVVVVQALPGREERGYDAQAIVDAVSTEMKGNSYEYETDFSAYEQKVEVEKSDIEINGRQGTFTRITVTSEFGFFSDEESNSSFYFATVRNGDIEYLFLLTASEEKAGKWERTAKRMAESMEFFTPANPSGS